VIPVAVHPNGKMATTKHEWARICSRIALEKGFIAIRVIRVVLHRRIQLSPAARVRRAIIRTRVSAAKALSPGLRKR
jgi:hypothetical protein